MLLWLLPWVWGRKKGPFPDNKAVISLQVNNVSSLLKECSNENSWANNFGFLHCNFGKNAASLCHLCMATIFSSMQFWQNVASLSHLCRTTMFQVCWKNAPMKIHGLKDNNVSSLLKECSNENSWANTSEFLHCNLGKNAASLCHIFMATIFLWCNSGKMLQICLIFVVQQCFKFVETML